jgi:hypothetical protein
MAILFVPNDPEASRGTPAARIKPRAARNAGSTDFDLASLPAQKVWPEDSREYLLWQCREAVLRTLAMWETIAGTLVHWQGGAQRRKLKVVVAEASGINAYYDRTKLSFYFRKVGNTPRTRWFAASVDVVSHETGHAFLDAVRPELWDSNFPEPNAFHEAFGDCVALLTSLADPRVRRTLLMQDPNLSKINFVETLMESLANAIREEQPAHNAALARHGRNTYRWTLPTTLPDDGGPGVLINEVHSFGQVFVGCFYDVIRNIFAAAPTRNSAALWKAAQTAGHLLTRGAIKAPHTPRFFQAVGRAMQLEDSAIHGGRHHDAISAAFGSHGIALAALAAVTPRAALEGAAPTARRTGRSTLEPVTLADLRARMGVSPRAALRMRAYDIGGRPVTEVSYERCVPLKGLSPRLAKVVAMGSEPAVVGGANERAAVLGALPDTKATHDEVRGFVASLVRSGAIATKPLNGGARAGPSAVGADGLVTHGVVREGHQLVLRRLRFSCGCRCAPR